MSIADAAASARAVTEAILGDLAKAERGVVVDSPPGAGKSTLVVAAAASLAERGERVIVVGQTNEQVDDLIDRLASEHGVLRIGRLSAQDYIPADRVVVHRSVTVSSSIADLSEHPLIIATAAKWAMLSAEPGTRRPWAIVDEAYQMRSDALLRIAHLFDKALFVGDPGQLDPFSTVETERWLGLHWDPMSSAVAVLLVNNPGIPVHTLPVSWRLPATAAAHRSGQSGGSTLTKEVSAMSAAVLNDELKLNDFSFDFDDVEIPTEPLSDDEIKQRADDFVSRLLD